MAEPQEGSHLLRFFVQSPNFLDDPQNVALFRERATRALQPRPIDKGRPSYWQAQTEAERTRVKAQRVVRSNKPFKFNVLSLGKGLVTTAGFVVSPERDDTAYLCVADLHCTLDLTGPTSLDDLIETIRAELESTLLENGDEHEGSVSYERIHLDEIESLITDAVRGCTGVDFSDASGWVHDIVGRSQM